ncbi:MAG: hypothetical protein OXH99_10950 [Bryobacterales bacterium]|nr:hypothetical protein [Bryobacterales bacterium]
MRQEIEGLVLPRYAVRSFQNEAALSANENPDGTRSRTLCR